MPRIFQITDDFAERFAFEPSRVIGVAKALRDAGLIQSGPRGVNAPEASPLDAARILIALMLRVKHHEAAEGVKLFGGFVPIGAEETEIAGKVAANFETALALLLEYCSAPNDDSPRAQHNFGEFEFSALIVRDSAMAKIDLGRIAQEDDERWGNDDFDGIEERKSLTFAHPHFAPYAIDGAPLTEELRTAWRQYRSGFHEIPTLTKKDLIDIGQVLGGHSPPLGTSK